MPSSICAIAHLTMYLCNPPRTSSNEIHIYYILNYYSVPTQLYSACVITFKTRNSRMWMNVLQVAVFTICEIVGVELTPRLQLKTMCHAWLCKTYALILTANIRIILLDISRNGIFVYLTFIATSIQQNWTRCGECVKWWWKTKQIVKNNIICLFLYVGGVTNRTKNCSVGSEYSTIRGCC